MPYKWMFLLKRVKIQILTYDFIANLYLLLLVKNDRESKKKRLRSFKSSI